PTASTRPSATITRPGASLQQGLRTSDRGVGKKFMEDRMTKTGNWRDSVRWFKISLSLIGVLGALVAPPAWAHQDPPGCNGVGVGIAIFPFRADGVTPIGSGSVTNCETLVFKAQVKYQPSTTSVPTCAF